MRAVVATKDWVMITAAAALLLAFVVIAWSSQHVLAVALAVLAAVLFVLVLQYRLFRTLASYIRSSLRNQLQQTESLLALFNALDIRRPLPGTGGTASSPDFLKLLAAEILRARPETVVEVGSGVSTLIAGYALKANGRGKLVSLDHLEKYADITREQVASHGLEDIVSVVYAPIENYDLGGDAMPWYDTSALGDVRADLLIVDGPPAELHPLARYPALPLLDERLGDGATVILDDAGRAGERRVVERWRREFPSFEYESYPSAKGTAILRKREPPGAR